jgi:plasmid maintenance system antidote protein VapI
MSTVTTKLYKNDWNYEPVRPWEIIEETLDYHEISVDTLAKELGFTDIQMSQLMRGEIPVNSKIADTLARLFKNSSETWEQLEDTYQKHKAIFKKKNSRWDIIPFIPKPVRQ